MESLEYLVPASLAGATVETVLRRELKLSGKRFRSLKFRKNGILRNGAPVYSDAVLSAGDRLTLSLTSGKPPSLAVAPSPLPLETVYEDAWLLVVNKPPHLSAHSEGSADCLAGRLQSRLNGEPAHLVNRLDKGTSGLLLAAKSGYLHDLLRRQLHSEALRREYLALVRGTPEPPEGEVTEPISPNKNPEGRYTVDPAGRPARTDYALLSAGTGLSLLRLTLKTGRTHQIRVHMAFRGWPLAGDRLYGGPICPGLDRPALHAWRLSFVHPMTGQELRFLAPLPEDLRSLALFSNISVEKAAEE
ncbi:MAG: RluA family pseudouridine synthase [Oscillospiraceae bacterium]|nr:RluA family pseudouridine synthase [Oscillospiraceae bacterium]